MFLFIYFWICNYLSVCAFRLTLGLLFVALSTSVLGSAPIAGVTWSVITLAASSKVSQRCCKETSQHFFATREQSKRRNNLCGLVLTVSGL